VMGDGDGRPRMGDTVVVVTTMVRSVRFDVQAHKGRIKFAAVLGRW
jgi:hypothetical protein